MGYYQDGRSDSLKRIPGKSISSPPTARVAICGSPNLGRGPDTLLVCDHWWTEIWGICTELPIGLVGMILVVELIIFNIIIVRSGTHNVVEDVIPCLEIFVTIQEHRPRLIVSQASSAINILGGTYARSVGVSQGGPFEFLVVTSSGKKVIWPSNSALKYGK